MTRSKVVSKKFWLTKEREREIKISHFQSITLHKIFATNKVKTNFKNINIVTLRDTLSSCSLTQKYKYYPLMKTVQFDV